MAPGDSKELFVYRTRGYSHREPDVAPFAQVRADLGHMGLRSGEVEEPRTWPPVKARSTRQQAVSAPARARANNRHDLEEWKWLTEALAKRRTKRRK